MMQNENDKKFLILQPETGSSATTLARDKRSMVDEEPTAEPEPSYRDWNQLQAFTVLMKEVRRLLLRNEFM